MKYGGKSQGRRPDRWQPTGAPGFVDPSLVFLVAIVSAVLPVARGPAVRPASSDGRSPEVARSIDRRAASVDDFQEAAGQADVALLLAVELEHLLPEFGVVDLVGHRSVVLGGLPLPGQQRVELLGELCLLVHLSYQPYALLQLSGFPRETR